MEQFSYLLVVPVVIVIAVVSLFRMGVLGKKILPQLPESGPLPVAELAQYYELGLPALAWERVRGWDLNEPVSFQAPPPIEHVILTPRLLDFCTAKSGKLEMVFNFLVGAIQSVTFDPGALPPGSFATGQGLVTVFTPSGETRLIATQGFVNALKQAMAQAQRTTT
jgi:hypothetical protein